MSDHPRFPSELPAELHVVVADEVDITLAGYPSKRSLETAITAYAEQLDFEGFIESDVREGFKRARREAGQFAPTPTEVRLCVESKHRTRRQLAEPKPAEEAFEPVDIPEHVRQAWRESLGPKPEPRQAPPIVFRDGKAIEPGGVSVAEVVSSLVPAPGGSE